MTIQIANLYHDRDVLRNGGVYIGRYRGSYGPRRSPLGNPFVIDVDGTRDQVIEKYRVWLRDKIDHHDPDVTGEIARLSRILEKQKTITLVCFCNPLACHGDVIADVLKEVFSA